MHSSTSTHAPAWQLLPALHARPHMPQFFGSLLRSTQPSRPHTLPPLAHTQLPATQLAPARHASPQRPQFRASLFRSTQPLEHSLLPFRQMHAPAVHAWSLAQAVSDGFIGQFAATPERRTAFWFMIFALPMMLAGQVAAHAAQSGDLALLRLIGWYVLAIALIGVAAFPKSPFWGALLLAPLLLAAGHGWF